jgi:hypothetical protein
MLPCAKQHLSRKITAVAMITAAISGLRFVQPIDLPSIVMRWMCVAVAFVGFGWLAVLLLFPPAPPSASARTDAEGQITAKKETSNIEERVGAKKDASKGARSSVSRLR